MRFDIRHVTRYRYDRPVHLGPHILRLKPRADGNQRLLDYRCTVAPEPAVQSNVLDAEGNQITRLWFTGRTHELCIASSSRVETLLDNPYGYLVDNPATGLPMPYEQNEAALLAACRHPGTHATAVSELAERLARESAHNTLAFLSALNGFLHAGIAREIRAEGPPQSPACTLQRGRGACRDLAVLFIAVCRLQGIAARFVSGYQAHAEIARRRRYLHAWPEVYIPGGGWRGYDPSHGTAVADAHVPVAASCRAAGALPVSGAFFADGAHSTMDFELHIHTDA
jgi:transglutaminase-like putative cysteine protease